MTPALRSATGERRCLANSLGRGAGLNLASDMPALSQGFGKAEVSTTTAQPGPQAAGKQA